MTLLEGLRIFVKNILHWLYAMALLSTTFFVWPSPESVSVRVFTRVKKDLLPPDVELIVTNPMSAFVSQIWLSILLAFLATLPLLLYKIVLYIRPALLPHEKRLVLWILLPSFFLFFFGVVYSYLFLIPATFKVLYPYAILIEAVPLFSIDEFISYIFGLLIAVGLVFLLPLFMIMLSFVRVIEAEFWMRRWRHSLVFFMILSAIITPDGTGVTMIILFLPLAILYFAGYIFAKKLSKFA